MSESILTHITPILLLCGMLAFVIPIATEGRLPVWLEVWLDIKAKNAGQNFG